MLIDLSVHQLVDLLLRTGDIDTRYFNTGTMQEGSKLHKEYQDSHKTVNFESEVDLVDTIKIDKNIVHFHGRADAISLNIDNLPIIEEIKTTNDEIREFFDQNEQWHLGQAICYAYMYAKKYKKKKVGVKLIYLSQIKKDYFSKEYFFTFKELKEYVYSLISKYLDFYLFITKKILIRNKSITKSNFPFEYRKGQKCIVDTTKETIESNDISFIEAATGLGKSLSVLFGALKGMEKGNVEHIFFLCAKNSGFDSASEAAYILKDSGIKFSFCELYAKEKMCLNSKKECNPDSCPYAKGYFDKRIKILEESIVSFNDFTSNRIKEIAKKNKVCAFELSLDLSLYCDVIICDYNYIFNPISYLKRFLDAPDSKIKLFLLVDEAHNLIQRTKEMFSISLSYSQYKKARLHLNKLNDKKLKETIKKLNQDFLLFKHFEYEKGLDYCLIQDLDDDFIYHLNSLTEDVRRYERGHRKFNDEAIKEYSLEVFKFLTIYSFYNQTFKIFLKKIDDDFEINIYCLDASQFNKEILSKMSGAVFFSGTLNPIEYYEKLITNSSDYKFISLKSPFPKKNFDLIVNNSISIRYKNRDSTLPKVAKYIISLANNKIGNYIVFVPSFDYLKKLKNSKYLSTINTIYQTNQMTTFEKDKFLSNFEFKPNKTTVGICVLGGSFSEGIDLVDDRLIGVVIVGVGLPCVCFENNLQKEYFDSNGYDGFLYAYTNPGMNKVMQAVGRLIRSEKDRGVALLIDDRYFYKTYSQYFVNSWVDFKKITSVDAFGKEIKSFFK